MGSPSKDALEELIERNGGWAVIDGGLATQLEALGANIKDPLYSAICLMTNPDMIKQVHLQYLEAGADIIMTSSYQATISGFHAEGLSFEEAEMLLQRSVTLALEARDEIWESVLKNPDLSYNRALVVASLGSYGAYLADGSEYSECYEPEVNLEALKIFHRGRLQVIVEAGPDMLVFETIPNKLEVQAIVELLDEETISIPSWISFSSSDGEHMCSGETFKECLDIINKSDRVKVVGINCLSPQFAESLILQFKQLTEKRLAVYPNHGEIWDGMAKVWHESSEGFDDERFASLARKWYDAGASLIGGCCLTTPKTIQAISKALKKKDSDEKILIADLDKLTCENGIS